MAEATQAAPQKTEAVKAARFIVEVGDEKGRSPMFPPLGMRILRGAFSISQFKGQNVDEDFAEMPNLPGMRIDVSIKNGKAELRVYDPLILKEFKSILDQARRICLAKFKQKYGPDRSSVLSNPNASVVKNFLYWTRRLLDAKQCRVIRGEVPSMAAIFLMTGQVSFESYNQKAGAKKREREEIPYVSLADAIKSESTGGIEDTDFDPNEIDDEFEEGA